MNKSANRLCASFLRAILRRMRELGLNQTALAKRMHVSRAYISKVLQGSDVNFSFATALRFARALELDFFPSLSPARPKTKKAES